MGACLLLSFFCIGQNCDVFDGIYVYTFHEVFNA